MKKDLVIIVILLFLPILNLSAFNWTGDNVPEDEAFKILTITNSGMETNMTLQDKKSNTFKIVYTTPINKIKATKIIELKNQFFNWENLQIAKIKFIVMSNSIEISVIPDKFVCSGTNIASYLPAGMFFTYTDSLQYNFRITKNNLFLRIKGYFLSEPQFCEKIQEALANPAAYIKKRDPEYFLAKLEQLQDDMNKLIKENSMLRWAVITLINEDKIPKKVIAEVVRLKKKNHLLNKSQIRDILERKNIDISKDEVNIILTVYFNDYDD